jgi:hypothetical protein
MRGMQVIDYQLMHEPNDVAIQETSPLAGIVPVTMIGCLESARQQIP